VIRVQLRCRPKATAAELASLAEVTGWLVDVHGFLVHAERADRAGAVQARRAFERLLTMVTLEIGRERRRHEGDEPALVPAVRRPPPLT
jgi:hypothetical protein